MFKISFSALLFHCRIQNIANYSIKKAHYMDNNALIG